MLNFWAKSQFCFVAGRALLLASLAGIPTSAAHQILAGRYAAEKVVVPDANLTGIGATIQSAINSLPSSGGVIHLAAGQYNMENTWHSVEVVGKSNITFEGDGPATKFISMAGSDGADAYFFVNNCSGITFRNFNMTGLPLPQSAWGNNTAWHTGLQISNSTNVTAENLSFVGFFTGAIKLQSCSSAHLRGNYFDQVSNKNGGDYGAVGLESSTDIVISGNTFTNLFFSGISTYSGNNLTISDNQFSFYTNSSYTMGVYGLQGLSNSVISGNRFLNAANEGITISGGGGNAVQNNTISGNVILAKFSGVNINLLIPGCGETSAAYNNITGNLIYGTTTNKVQHGIFLNKAQHTNVTGNTIHDANVGINMQDCISDNIIGLNQVDNANTAITVNGKAMVIGNYNSNSGSGITQSYSSRSSIVHNRMESISGSKVYVDPSASNIYQDDNQ